MALTQTATIPGPGPLWDEEVVPALRKSASLNTQTCLRGPHSTFKQDWKAKAGLLLAESPPFRLLQLMILRTRHLQPITPTESNHRQALLIRAAQPVHDLDPVCSKAGPARTLGLHAVRLLNRLQPAPAHTRSPGQSMAE